MIFLNALLVAGSLAASIPLIIHLLNRSRFKVVDWGAMHLLESALKINSRRVQWQAWLLLFLRMMIPAILAFCLARPVLTAWRTPAGGNGHSIVIVVDNSLSMEAASADDGSCLDAAIAQASSIVSRFGPATEITLLTAGGGVIDQTSGATMDSKRALRRLRDVRGGAGPAAIGEALSTGFARLAKAKQPRRHLILLSDFQRSQFDNLPPESLATLREAAPKDAPPIEVTFIPIRPKSLDNLSVQIDRPLGASVVTPAQTLEVRVAIRNHGRERIKGLPVVLSADGTALANKNVEVAGDSQVFLAFSCQLQTLGSHVLSVSIDEKAARAASNQTLKSVVTSDDVSRWSVEVIEPVHVGIVTARPPNSKTVDDATFLNLALSPYAVSMAGSASSEETAGWAEAQAGADPIKCELISPQEVTDQWLAGKRSVVLTNIAKLDDATADRIERFVRSGGMLMIWTGDALQSKWYNERWGSASSAKLLPADYGPLSRPSDRKQASLKIQSQSYEHPALTFFNRSSNGRLDSIDLSTWFQLQRPGENKNAAGSDPKSNAPSTSLTEDRSVLTMLSLDNGEPLLLERIVGRGRVMQWAISCGQRWSNLPLREVFVPMMQQMVLYGATSSMPQLNIDTGSLLAVAMEENAAEGKADPKQKQATAASDIELLTPQNLRFRLEADRKSERPSVQFAATHYPGAYQLSGIRQRPLVITAGVRAEESVLAPLEQSALGEMAQRLDAQIQESAESFWQGELVKQTGREIWRPLLAALVIFLLAELLLQQSLTRTPA